MEMRDEIYATTLNHLNTHSAHIKMTVLHIFDVMKCYSNVMTEEKIIHLFDTL